MTETRVINYEIFLGSSHPEPKKLLATFEIIKALFVAVINASQISPVITI